MAQYNYWPRYGPENFSLILPLENNFDAVKSTVWMQNNWHHSFTWSLAYVVVIFGGRKLMANRKPFDLEIPLFIWNALLAVFSLMGFIRMAPEWLWSWNDNSFVYSICVSSYAQGVTGFWTEQFAMSKVAELLDTVFIVARKKPLIFLHWYHHISVLVYTWHAYKDHTASGRWFIFMNYGVHAFMYTYYALRAARIWVPKPAAMLITILQISQMVMGVIIGVTVYRTKSSGESCQQTWENLGLCFLIYLSYFLLFCNFFYHAYLKKNNRYVKAEKEKANKPQENGYAINNKARDKKEKEDYNANHLMNGNGKTSAESVTQTKRTTTPSPTRILRSRTIPLKSD
ncbi:hypothetical protein WR25_20397 [Diploscapter pachys]|uniref:Elongation of very long chain fatty acids protein n=1 Tax=Diploscapter pachys TaxID=2018661 RepID=A0A2A2JM88_9BILA|nr:hypothetical protein WR25_20397 [Diploscapter pachys]